MSTYFDATSNRVSNGVTARASDLNGLRDEVGEAFDLLNDPDALNNGTTLWSGASTGSANIHAVAMPNTLLAYAAGVRVVFRAGYTSTSTTPTLNVDTLGAKVMVNADGTALAVGDIVAGGVYEAIYSSTSDKFHINSVGTATFNAKISAAESAQSAAETAQSAAESAQSSAETAASGAAASETAAAASETAAAASETAAGLSETAAAASETAAGLSETAAGLSETAAQTAQGLAETAQAAAELAETNAAASETAAAASETAAAASETAAAASETAAAASETSAAASFDSFDDRYLGAKSSDPALDNDGDALLVGALYWNTVSDGMKIYDGSVWQTAFSYDGGDINLSDGSIITGNFGNATLADRPAFVDSATNAGTIIQAKPNGTGTSSGILFWNDSTDMDNAEYMVMSVRETYAEIRTQETGTGIDLPIWIRPGGSTTAEFEIDGTINVSNVSNYEDLVTHDDDIPNKKYVDDQGFTKTYTAINKTLVANEHVRVGVSGKTMTLPASPTDGDRIRISVRGFSDTVIGRNGKSIKSTADDAIINKDYATVELIYTGADSSWDVIQ